MCANVDVFKATYKLTSNENNEAIEMIYLHALCGSCEDGEHHTRTALSDHVALSYQTVLHWPSDCAVLVRPCRHHTMLHLAHQTMLHWPIRICCTGHQTVLHWPISLAKKTVMHWPVMHMCSTFLVRFCRHLAMKSC